MWWYFLGAPDRSLTSAPSMLARKICVFSFLSLSRVKMMNLPSGVYRAPDTPSLASARILGLALVRRALATYSW